jgi:hypothetical protein
MISGISGATTSIDFSPTDITDLPAATVKAHFQIAALKTEQDMMMMQGQELARLMEPHKGANLDARA